jgi:thiamine biosynthesis lipoprotein
MFAERQVLVGLLLSAASALLLIGCRGAETPVYTTQFVAFDSAVDLSIVGVLKEDAQAAATEVEQDLLFLDYTTHAWKPGPMVRVNELLARGEPFAAPPSILPLVRQSQALALQSGNLFNPAIGHLYRLWGFHVKEPECRPPPANASISRVASTAPTMADIYLDGIMLQSDNPAARLDFNGIAVGYAMDLAMENLRARGIRHALINKGTDVRTMGDRAGRPWRIPIRRGSGSGVLATVDVVGDASVFTSADYARNFIYDGQTYHDVIDPRSGRPAEGIKAVTVLHQGPAVVANAGAVALMVAGMDEWPSVAERMGLEYVLLIDEAGTVHMTQAMSERVKLIDRQADVSVTALSQESAPDA